jgi:competence protein ComFC
MLKSALKFLLDLLFPIVCQSCGAEGEYLCLGCSVKIESPIHRCPACSKNSLLGRVHDECVSRKIALTGLMVVAEYKDQAIRKLIWQLKYNSVENISHTLALLMADFFIRADITEYFSGSLVISVPMHPRRQRMRGFNQAENIARLLAKKMDMRFAPALRKIKNTTRQVDMKREERFENVKGAFALDKNVNEGLFAGRKIILIDDVATTGATLNECALMLKDLEPAEIWGLVVARN